MSVIVAGTQFNLEASQWLLRVQGDRSTVSLSAAAQGKPTETGLGVWFRFEDNGSLVFDLSRLSESEAQFWAEIKSPIDFHWSLSSLNSSEGYSSSGQMLSRGAEGVFLTISREGEGWRMVSTDIASAKGESPSSTKDFITAQANARTRSGITVLIDSSSVNLPAISSENVEKFMEFCQQMAKAFSLQEFKIEGASEGTMLASIEAAQSQVFGQVSGRIQRQQLADDPARVLLRDLVAKCSNREQIIVLTDTPFFISDEVQKNLESKSAFVDIICLTEGEILSTYESPAITVTQAGLELDAPSVQKALLN